MDAASFKKTFFDTKAVADKVPPAVKAALSKFGAFTRRRDQTSLKYRDKPAAPGKPPSVHRGKRFTRTKKSKGTTKVQRVSPLRELTFFGFDAQRQSVVIGPAAFRSSQAGPGVLPPKIEERHPHTLPAFRAETPDAANKFTNLVR